MKNSKIFAMLSVCALIAVCALNGCAQPSSPAKDPAATSTSVTSVSQIPAGTWTGTKTESGRTIEITIVATGSSTARMTMVSDMTEQVKEYAKKSGMTEAAVWTTIQTQNASQGYKYSSGSPYTVTQTQTLTDSMLQASPGSLLNDTLTVTFKNQDNTTTPVTFTKKLPV